MRGVAEIAWLIGALIVGMGSVWVIGAMWGGG